MTNKNEDTGVALVAEAADVATTRLLSTPAEKLTVIEQTQAYVIIKTLGKALESRTKELRAPLLALAEAQGKPVGDKGTKKYLVDGNSVCAEHRQSESPDPTKLKDLLVTRKIDISEAFEEVKALQLNPSKLKFLVDTGKLTAAEVKALCPDIPALKVLPGKALKEALSGLKLASSLLEDEQSCLPPGTK